MARLPGSIGLLPAIPILLAHLAGVVVAVVLLLRPRERPIAATLAAVGFGLLLALDVGNFARGPLTSLVARRTAAGVRLIVTGLGCCCSVVDVAATVCLIIAIAQALSGAGREGTGGRR